MLFSIMCPRCYIKLSLFSGEGELQVSNFIGRDCWWSGAGSFVIFWRVLPEKAGCEPHRNFGMVQKYIYVYMANLLNDNEI